MAMVTFNNDEFINNVDLRWVYFYETEIKETFVCVQVTNVSEDFREVINLSNVGTKLKIEIAKAIKNRFESGYFSYDDLNEILDDLTR